MSDFNYSPVNGPTATIDAKTLEASFGDGYEQRVGDGINTMREVWNLTFTGSRAYVEEIYTFLKSKAGVTSFTWTPPGGTEIKVTCKSWSKPIISKFNASINATFKQVFE
jgi:phage-related protein